MGTLGYPTKGGNWERVGSFCKPKSFNFLLLLDITPTQVPPSLSWSQTIYWEKSAVSLIRISNFLTKDLQVTRIFSYTITTHLKKLDRTKSLNTKQYSAGLFPRILSQLQLYHFLTKISLPLKLLCCNHQGVDCLPFPWTFMRNPEDGQQSYPTTKNLHIFWTRKENLP